VILVAQIQNLENTPSKVFPWNDANDTMSKEALMECRGNVSFKMVEVNP
jgi:hypothetical protein